MPRLAERMAAMERDKDFRALPPDAQNRERAALREKVRREYDAIKADVSAKANEQRSSMEQAIGPTASSAAHSAMAGVLAAGNTAGLGYLPKIASMVPGGPDEDRAQASLDLAAAQHPIASTVGSLAGNFIGPAGKVAQIGARAAAYPVKAAINALGVQGAAALTQEFGRRFAVATLKNLVGGAGAIAATEATRSRADDASLGQRLSDAMSMATNPTAVGMSVLAGGVQAKLGRPVSAELASAVARYERITGKRVPIETLTDSAGQKGFYDSIARIPGMQDHVQKQRKAAVAGLAAVVDDIRARSGAASGGRETVRGRAAETVKGIAGDDQARLGSALSAERRAAANTAIGPIGQSQIPSHMFGRLELGWQRLKAGRPRNADAPELDAAFAQIAKLKTAQDMPTLQEFEVLRQTVGGIGHNVVLGAKQVGGREKYEARRAYDLISALGRHYYPDYGRALDTGKVLRSMEQALGDVNVSQVDDATMQSFFSSRSAIKNWDTLARKSLPEDIAAAKGWLFYSLMRRVSNADGYINPETLDKVTSQGGRFNSQIINKVLPGVLDDLKDHAKLTASMLGKGAGRFGPVGSETATRGARMVGLLAYGSIPAVATATAYYLSNPHVAALSVLGPAGVKAVLRSALGGHLEGAMQNLSRQGSTPISRSAVAAQQAAPDFNLLKQSLVGIPRGAPQ